MRKYLRLFKFWGRKELPYEPLLGWDNLAPAPKPKTSVYNEDGTPLQVPVTDAERARIMVAISNFGWEVDGPIMYAMAEDVYYFKITHSITPVRISGSYLELLKKQAKVL